MIASVSNNSNIFSFEPFIYEIPRELSAADKILHSLGAGNSPSIADIIKVLHDVQIELRGLALNPSEIIAVGKMLVRIQIISKKHDIFIIDVSEILRITAKISRKHSTL